MTLAQHVRTLGRGPGRSRSLTEDEARDAMRLMLAGAAPEAVGALLMLLRMKGETAEEIAGLAFAAQAAVPDLPQVDLDWPSYAAGRTRGLPWFLLSARLVAESGKRVLLHGWNGQDGAVRAGLAAAGIALARNAEEAERALTRDRIVYMPLEDMHPALFKLLNLREILGLRSCVNTVCRMLNPGRASASVQGVFHPSYRLLQQDAALLLGWRSLSVIKGGGGECERHPGKAIAGFGLRDGAAWQADLPARLKDGRRLADVDLPADSLRQFWTTGTAPESAEALGTEAFVREMVLGTAELALDTLGTTGEASGDARALWAKRKTELPA